MTPGLSKDIGCRIMIILLLNLQFSEFTRSDIRPHIKLAVCVAIQYCHFNLPPGGVGGGGGSGGGGRGMYGLTPLREHY